jgi:hypothetical protein
MKKLILTKQQIKEAKEKVLNYQFNDIELNREDPISKAKKESNRIKNLLQK